MSFKSLGVLIGLGILAFVGIIGLSMSFYTVPQYGEGVVTSWGKFNHVAVPGGHFKLPIRDSVRIYRTDIQTMSPTQPVNIYTVDNQEVDVTFTIFYTLPPDRLEYIYQNVQDYQARLMSMAVDRLKAEMGKVNVQTLAGKRGDVRDAIKAVLVKDSQVLGIKVTDFQLTDMQYAASFRAAVASAANAKAMIETRENERLQAEKVAETAQIKAQGVANAVKAAADGDAYATLAKAKAEAQAIQLKGEAQAKAIKAQSDALSKNPTYVAYIRAKNWDGKLPVQMLSGITPFMSFKSPDEVNQGHGQDSDTSK